MNLVALYALVGVGYSISKIFIMRDEDMFAMLYPQGMPKGAFFAAMAVSLIIMGALWPLMLLGDGFAWLRKKRESDDVDS